MTKLSTGDLAEMLGLTNQGIRYMEQMGIIHPTRNQNNGYREYKYDDYVRLKRAKSFRALGFSLEEARSMLDGDMTLKDTKSLYSSKLKQLEKKRRELEIVEEDLLLQQSAIEMAEAGESAYNFRVPELMVFCPRKINGEAIQYSAQIVKANNQWTKSVPQARMFAVYYSDNEEKKGSVLTVKDFEELDLPQMENLIFLDLGLCAHGAIIAPRMQRPNISAIMSWIKAQGKEAVGDVYCIMRLSVQGENGGINCIHEFFAPIQ